MASLAWVVHFPPKFPGCDSCLDLIDAELLMSAALDESAIALLTGHTHEPREYTAGPPVMTAGSATQYGEPRGNYLHLVEIRAEGAEKTIIRRTAQWDRKEGEFLPVVSSGGPSVLGA